MKLKYIFTIISFQLLLCLGCVSYEKELSSLNTARTLYRSGKVIEGIQYLNQIIDKSNLDEDTIYEAKKIKVSCLIRLKEYESALLLLSNMVGITKNDPEVFSLRGDCYFSLKKYDSALLDYTRLADVFYSIEGYNKRGVLYIEMGKYDLATEDIDNALRMDSLNWEILNNKAKILYLEDRNNEALNYYEKALQIKPDNIVLHNMGLTFESLKMNDSACFYYKKASGRGFKPSEIAFNKICDRGE